MVRIPLTTLNYKKLRKERKRRNSGHQKVRKTAKTSFPFRLPNSQSDDQFNSKAIRDSADIRNTATVISAIWVPTVTVTGLIVAGSIKSSAMIHSEPVR